MKRIICILVFVLLLTSCENDSLKPYITIDEDKALKQVDKIDWEKLIDCIPDNLYIQYDGMHSVPLTATLYKNGECLPIELYDERLVRLLNFYHNEVYFGEYSYSQGTANDLYNEQKDCSFRLELTFAKVEGATTIENSFDKMVVVENRFYGIRTYLSWENDSYSAYIRTPLYDVGTNFNWLTMFGF